MSRLGTSCSSSSKAHDDDSESDSDLNDSARNDMYDEADRCLKSRGIDAEEVAYDPRFDSKVGAAHIAREMLVSPPMGCEGDDGDDPAVVGKLLEGLAKAFDGAYATEKDFHVSVFKAMATCFDSDGGSQWKVEHFPPKKDCSKKHPPRLVVMMARRSRTRGDVAAETTTAALAAAAAAGDVGEAAPDTAESGAASVEGRSSLGSGGGRNNTRSVSSKKQKTRKACPAEEDLREKVGGEDWGGMFEPFVAHAQYPPPSPNTDDGGDDDDVEEEEVSANDDADSDEHKSVKGGAVKETTSQGQQQQQRRRTRLQHTEYAIGLVRNARVPARKGGIVKDGAKLDHAVVILCRGAARNAKTNKKKRNGGWRVCQVLATVGLKIVDSTRQHTLDRMSGLYADRVTIKGVELGRTGGVAGPVGQQVLHALGHALWCRAALGLELPPSLPFAVVTARRATGKAKPPAAAAWEPDAENDPSKRMRWVYGRLAVPEECGGRFSYSVSSCGPLDGTAPESAVAAYLSVVSDGLEAGERWIETMLLLKNPTPSDDTRPWPSSLCGRQLCFGGPPLNLLDKKLVATPARMRELELPISQGELYRGRVNLTELRNLQGGKRLRDVVWCQDTSEAHRVDAKAPASEAAKDMVMVKVASKACHSLQLLPAQGLLWNLDSYPHLPGHVSRVLNLVSGSLHAIYNVDDFDSGLVQLMPNLQAAGYLPLRPKHLEKQGRLQDMCKAFEHLIEETLVPLALLGVIHADLRTTYLETANMLCHKDDLTMRLIDLDSLMMFHNFHGLLEDPRIISPENGTFAARIKSAIEFVCLQAVCLATAWLIGKRIDSTTDDGVRSKLKNELATEKIIGKYLVERVGHDANVDRDARLAHFSIPDTDACSFVLRAVRPTLEELLGESTG